ncbi:short-chain dehydrogenase [Halioglobus sp. HI00S01]|uniref:SDR family NAD(P)-dependent oxidoreductase n=1 Tax=Halioglobus sp. HI00S01 TaxID=1822214 RepID=UPI0007C2E2DB|nr:SDR family oxidoreductase [Halioglobus sp. HI00S01]KZX60443.1 short-chain dehydrogenase [Halioglobus sp. HI00S01]
MQRFTGKVALITGAASGIGRATAIRLANEDAALFLTDINKDGLTETVKALPEGVASAIAEVDVTQPAACNAAVEACIERFDKLDVLCNIAGIAFSENLTDISDAQWDLMVGINLNGVFFMSRAAMPHLLASKGNIVNMSSSAGREGQAYNSAYCATKAGVLMFSKALAMEFGKQEVRVNAVCPGFVQTPLSAGFKMPEGADMELFSRLLPLVEASTPEEIAGAVAYLASDEARFVNGIELPIDGGQTAG